MVLDFLDTTTLCGVSTTSTGTINGDIEVDSGAVSTTASTVSSMLTSNPVDIDVKIGSTRDYISTMSTEEIDELLAQIDEKENNMLVEEENVKVKTLGSKHNI